MSRYTATWAIITPIKGRPTKKDQEALGKERTAIRVKDSIIIYFATEEIGREYLSKPFKLTKTYQVVFIKDAQTKDIHFFNQSYLDVATTQQLSNAFTI